MIVIDVLNENSGSVTAIATVILAVITFYYLLETSKIRKESEKNRESSEKQAEKSRILSIRPYGNITLSDYQNKLAIEVENAGMGPLIVKSIETSKGIYGIKGYPKDWIDDTMPEIIWADFRNDLEEHAIASGDTCVLLEYNLRLVESSKEEMNQVRQILKDLTITIKYSDIYNNEQPILRRELGWFGRNNRKQQSDVG